MYHGTSGPSAASFTTFRDKMLNVVASATDVEGICRFYHFLTIYLSFYSCLDMSI